ncbi:hypothetical protein YC2023_056677 [Brassica napus]
MVAENDRWKGPYQYEEPNRGNINKVYNKSINNSSVICQTTTIKLKNLELKLVLLPPFILVIIRLKKIYSQTSINGFKCVPNFQIMKCIVGSLSETKIISEERVLWEGSQKMLTVISRNNQFSDNQLFSGHHHHHHHRRKPSHSKKKISICDDFPKNIPPPDTDTTSYLCVDKNGCCNFTTVQSAVDAIGNFSQRRNVIWINSGMDLSRLHRTSTSAKKLLSKDDTSADNGDPEGFCDESLNLDVFVSFRLSGPRTVTGCIDSLSLTTDLLCNNFDEQTTVNWRRRNRRLKHTRLSRFTPAVSVAGVDASVTAVAGATAVSSSFGKN